MALSAAMAGLSFASSLFGPDKNAAAIQQAKAEYGRRLHEYYGKLIQKGIGETQDPTLSILDII